jgi:N-acetylneuraminic acid mutarotase
MFSNRTEITASILNDKIYVIGGVDYRNGGAVNTVEIYDPLKNEWTDGAPLPEPRAAHIAEIVNGTIYAISGLDFDHHAVTTNFAYNIENNTWNAKEPMPDQNGPKHHAASAAVDGKIYVLGGRHFGN